MSVFTMRQAVSYARYWETQLKVAWHRRHWSKWHWGYVKHCIKMMKIRGDAYKISAAQSFWPAFFWAAFWILVYGK